MIGKHYKRNAPSNLAALIQLANSVPPGLELPMYREIGTLMNTPAFDGFRALNDLPKAPAQIPKASYNDLFAARALLRRAVEYNSRSPEEDEVGYLLSAVATISRLPYLFIVPRVDDCGRLRFSLGKILDALEGVEIGRIRQCPVCGRIFWAARIDQKAHDHRCANTLRVRNSRSPEGKLKRYRNEEWRENRRRSPRHR